MRIQFDCFRDGIFGGFLALLAALILVTPAFGQANTARWGGDYDYLSKNNARQCDRACLADRSCRAWTFIKRTGQCRLKYLVPDKVNSRCCVSGVKDGDHHGDHGNDGRQARCADYANKAIEQANQNLTDRCGFRGEQWHVNYRRHFNYCMDVRPRVQQRETRVRTRKLDQCRQQQQARGRVRCGHLARIAVQQSKTNNDNRCGFRGPYWNTSANRQVELCEHDLKDHGRGARYNFSKFEKREDRLRRCMLRGGGARDQACDNFSNSVVELYQRNVQYRCRYSNNIWNDNYDLQYDWCRSAGPRLRAQRLAGMNKQIRKCKKRRGWKKIFKF